MTRRFDRKDGKKIHVQTLAAIKHIDYNQIGAYSYEAYAECARKLGIGKEGIKQLFRRMVFNVLSANCDDHVKNFAFQMDRQGKWSLTPAYDLTFAYNPNNKWISEHQMLINNKSSRITDNDMIQSGIQMGLTREYCVSVVEEIRQVVNNWYEYAMKAGISESRSEEISHGIRKCNE